MTNELITDAMVEAASIALRNQTRERVGLSPLDRLPWSPASGEARADARAALEAVAPLIAARALRDAAEAFGENQTIREGDAKEWLRARADRIEHDARCPHPKCPGHGMCCCPEAKP